MDLHMDLHVASTTRTARPSYRDLMVAVPRDRSRRGRA
jgi:hypothetical protein